MVKLRRAIREDLDRIITDLLFIAFGVWSFFDRPVSLNRMSEVFACLFNVEFILIGILLLVGTVYRNYRIKTIGFGLYIVALGTMAALVNFVGDSTVSLLILAFAIRGYTSIKEMRVQRKFLNDLRKTLNGPGD